MGFLWQKKQNGGQHSSKRWCSKINWFENFPIKSICSKLVKYRKLNVLCASCLPSCFLAVQHSIFLRPTLEKKTYHAIMNAIGRYM